MRNLLFMLLSSAMVLSVDAWADTTPSAATNIKKKNVRCVFPKSKKRAPNWVCNASASGLAVAAVGSAAKSGAGIAFMQQMADADARLHLARILHGSARKSLANGKDADAKITEGRDSALITKIADESLLGTKIMKRAYGPDGTLYVLVGIDETSAQKLHESIANELKGKPLQ